MGGHSFFAWVANLWHPVALDEKEVLLCGCGYESSNEHCGLVRGAQTRAAIEPESVCENVENQAYSKTPLADASSSRLIQEIALGSYQHVVSFLSKGGVQAS
jgi:hypothetical protein